MSALLTTTGPQAEIAASSSDLRSIFDLDALVDRCMGDAGLAARLLDRFGDRLPITVAAANRSLAAQDRSEVLRQAHTLKGEAGSLSAVRLQQAAAELETSVRKAHEMRDPEIVRLAAALATAADQCRQRLPEAVAALSTSTNNA